MLKLQDLQFKVIFSSFSELKVCFIWKCLPNSYSISKAKEKAQNTALLPSLFLHACIQNSSDLWIGFDFLRSEDGTWGNTHYFCAGWWQDSLVNDRTGAGRVSYTAAAVTGSLLWVHARDFKSWSSPGIPWTCLCFSFCCCCSFPDHGSIPGFYMLLHFLVPSESNWEAANISWSHV